MTTIEIHDEEEVLLTTECLDVVNAQDSSQGKGTVTMYLPIPLLLTDLTVKTVRPDIDHFRPPDISWRFPGHIFLHLIKVGLGC